MGLELLGVLAVALGIIGMAVMLKGRRPTYASIEPVRSKPAPSKHSSP